MDSSPKWMPFKDLLEATENFALNKTLSLHNLKLLLRKHKPDFFSLLKNQVQNGDDRKTVKLRAGMSVQGNLKVIDSVFIEEVMIISDMFELNELISFDLLLTGEQQKPNYTNYSRGLVAVMLYWDGRRNLVSALRTLIQCRKGNSWTLDISEDATSLATSFTAELLSHGLIEKLLKLLESIQVEAELEKLSQQKGLGDSRHRKQMRDLITEVRQCLADCVFFAAAQSELTENDVIAIVEHLRKHADVDGDGKLSSTSTALLFAALYCLKISVDIFTEEDAEDILRQSRICEEDFMKRIHNELVDDTKTWKVPSVRSYMLWTWSLTLRLLSQSSLSSSFNLGMNEVLEQDEALLESALSDRVFFSFKENIVSTSSFHSEEFYLRLVHSLITDLIVNMPLKVKEMRSSGDETARIIMLHLAEGEEFPSERRRDFQHLMELIAAVYDQDPLDLQLAADYWCVSEQSLTSDGTYVTPRRMPHKQMALFKFVRQSGDILPPLLYIPYLHMLSALSTGPRSSRAAFELLRANSANGDALISWEHFFRSCQQYFDNLRQAKPFHEFSNPFMALQSPVVKQLEVPTKLCTITPQEIEGLRAVMKLTAKIAQYDDIACLAFLEDTHWCVCGTLFGLLQCPVPVLLKGDILLVLRQFARLPGVGVTLLQASEHSQLLRKQPGVEKLGGIACELEEIESRDEEYPMTRGFVKFIEALVDSNVHSLGENILHSLSFIVDSLFLRLLSRAYAKPEEKWEVAGPCLNLFNKILAQYNPSPGDFVSERVLPPTQEDMSLSQVKPPPPHPGMSLLCYLYNEGDFFATVMEIITSCIEYFETYVTKPALERTLVAAAEPALQLLLHGLELQDPFLSVLRNSGSPLLVTALDNVIVGVNPKTQKADYILTLSSFVRHNGSHSRLSLLAIQILSWLCSSSSHRQMVTRVMSTCDHVIREEVVNGFVEILDTGAVETNEDVEQSLVSQQRQAILRLMLHCIDQPAPNFSHMLLGFDSNKRLSQGNLQDPGVLGSSRSCLHSILSILSTHDEQPHAVKATPKLAELCYQLIYKLARNRESSEIVLRYLRSSHDFFYKHLQYLPFETDGTTNISLMQQSWLLKTSAIELHLLASKQQRTNAQRLIQVLFNKSACAMDGSFSMIGQSFNQSERSKTGDVSLLASSFLNTSSGKMPSSKPMMLELFDIVDLSQDFPPPLSLDQFVLSVVEESIKSCETTDEHGVVFCDVKVLHHLLDSSLSSLASEDMTRKRLATQDVQNILRTAVKRNEVRAAVHSKLHFITSWKQVLEVILTSCPDDVLLKATRQQVVFTVLQHLVKASCDNDAAQELTSSLAPIILTLSMQIRASVSKFNADHSLPSPNEELPQDVINILSTFQIVVRGIIDWLLLSGINQKARVSLYASLLYYLQLCKETRLLDAGSRDFTCLRSLQEGIYSRFTRENTRLLRDFGDSFKSLLCKDAFNGHSICRVLAYGCLDSILQSDTEQVWLQYMLKNGYLNHIASSFCDEDQPLQQYLNPATRPLRAVYIFEQKMALLCSIAHTPGGARAIINSQVFPELAKCSFLDMRPRVDYNDEAQSSLVLSRYRQLLFPVLHLCSSLLNALGGSSHHECCAVVLQFLLSHDQSVVMSVLRSNAFDQQSLSELCLVSGILCQVAGQDFTNSSLYPDIPQAVLLEIQANLLRIQRSLMHMLPNYLITDSVMSSLKERSENSSSYETTALTLHEITSNLLTYCRVVVTRSVDSDSILLFSPELSDSSPGISAYSSQLPRKPSLGILVKFLQTSLARLGAEKDQVKQLNYKFENIEKLNSQDLKEILGHSDDVMQLPVAQEKMASTKLKQSISTKNKLTKCLLYIVETSLFLLWHHLNQYVNQAVSAGRAKERILFPPKTPYKNTPRRLQDISNINNDEQFATSKFEFSPIDANQLKSELQSCVTDSMLKRLSSVESEGIFVQPLVSRIQRIKMLLN